MDHETICVFMFLLWDGIYKDGPSGPWIFGTRKKYEKLM